MTTALANPPHPTTTGLGVQPMWAYTAQELDDLRNDAFRAGYRLGRIHEAEAHHSATATRLPTVHPTT
jgi:hypothetical protein